MLRSLRGVFVMTALLGCAWGTRRLIAALPPARAAALQHRERDAALMRAGLDADRASLARARDAGDSAAMRVATQSMQRHAARLSQDVAALAARRPAATVARDTARRPDSAAARIALGMR